MSTRFLLGVSVGTGFDSVHAAVLPIHGIGLTLSAKVANTSRVPVPADVGAALRRANRDHVPFPESAVGSLAESAVVAMRKAILEAGLDPRRILAVGANGAIFQHVGFAEQLAEQLGITLISGFASRDVACGGSGRALAAIPDHLLFSHPQNDRLLIHLGSFTSVVWLPANGRVTEITAFDVGPGNSLLDEITILGTRGREEFDPGGTKAVQGRCLDELLTKWKSHSFLHRLPPRTLTKNLFTGPFVATGFDLVRATQGSLNDLLCTATQLIANGIGDAVRRWTPLTTGERAIQVFVSGGGVRNGFLWKLLEREFPGVGVERLDVLGVPAMARSAADAGVLAALTLDGVAGNLPTMTGANGSRLLGRVVPGDSRNWSACVRWMAQAQNDGFSTTRAA